MKIKITIDGKLEIWRVNRYKSQRCPYQLDTACNQRCPFFGEPEKIMNEQSLYSLSLCTTHLIGEIIDERNGWD